MIKLMKKEIINTTGYDEAIYHPTTTKLKINKSKYMTNNDSIVSNEPRILNIDLDVLNTINNALRPNVINTPPEGYYNAKELIKLTGLSKSQLIRRISLLKSENKVDVKMVLTQTKKGHLAIPYYKFLKPTKQKIPNSLY